MVNGFEIYGFENTMDDYKTTCSYKNCETCEKCY